MPSPKISIITPSFNQGQYIEETILSVISQRYPGLEFIIIDGGSTDNTVDVIKKYEKHISYWVSEKDRGQSHAMNKGLERAGGDIISVINSDDLLVEGALQKVSEIFGTLPENFSTVHGGTVIFNHHKVIKTDFGHPGPSKERYLSGLAFSHTASFIRKKYLDLIGTFNENLHYGMDYDLYARLALVSDFKKVDVVFTKYRIHSVSKSIAAEKKFVEDWIKVFISVIKKLGVLEVKKELEQMKVFENYFKEAGEYSFPAAKISLNKDLLLFYFLGDVFKADYRNINFYRAKIIGKYLTTGFEKYLGEDHELKVMIDRLFRYPPFLISAARKIKNKFF